jgi:hypothetical protein
MAILQAKAHTVSVIGNQPQHKIGLAGIFALQIIPIQLPLSQCHVEIQVIENDRCVE